jgi:hypothetical protein
LVYSTYLGGSGFEIGQGIAVDSAGNAYVIGTTTSTDFPTKNPLQPTNRGTINAFVTKVNATGSALVYSTYLGGSGQDFGLGIAVDSAGNAYVTGLSRSTDFPTKNPLQAAKGGDDDAFVSKINPTGSALVYSTYLGGINGTQGYAIAVDSAGKAYVTGTTNSTDFPTKNPLQSTYGGGNHDAFASKINSTGSALVYSTSLGGSGEDQLGGIAVDSAGDAYVTGQTLSTDFPTTPGAFQTVCNHGSGCAHYGGDAFVSKISPTGSALVYSTYIGGSGSDHGSSIAVDSAGKAYVTGHTNSTNFPTKNPLQPKNGGYSDAFVTKIDVRVVTTTKLSSSLNPSTYGQAVTFSAVVTSSAGAPPDGETIAFMRGGTKRLGTGSLSGGSASFTTSALPAGTDTIKAVYGGDSNFTGSTSKTVSQVVSKATTTTTLTSSQNPSNFGQSVTFTANVTPQFTGTVKGAVTFYDGTMPLKTAYLSGGVAKFTTSALTAGSHTITATYNGSTNFYASSASLTQKVN